MTDSLTEKILQVLDDSIGDLIARNGESAMRKAGDLRVLVWLADDPDNVLWLLWGTILYTYHSISTSLDDYCIPADSYEKALKQVTGRLKEVRRAISDRQPLLAYRGLCELATTAGDLRYQAGYAGWDKMKEQKA